MGNTIDLGCHTEDAKLDHLTLSMSNGLTDWFISALVFSGSQLAKEEQEKRLIVWLAERDQSAVGAGTVGFSISDMPWNRETFSKDQLFLLTVIEHAKTEQGWGQLGALCPKHLLLPQLDQFAVLISQFQCFDIQPSSFDEWLTQATEQDPVRCGFPLCPIHHTLLTIFGCQVCNHERSIHNLT